MTSRRALLTSVGAASAGLAGCNYLFGNGDDGESRHVPGDWTPAPGEWSGPRYDFANTCYNPHASPPTTESSVAWEDEWGQVSVLVADGIVFLRTSRGLRGLNAEDGTQQLEVSRPAGGLYRYVDGRLYDDTIEGIDALTLNGESVWDDPIYYDDSVVGLVERDGFVYLSTETDTIHHHDAGTGERVGATVHDVGVRRLANHDGILYAALADGLVAYDVADDGSLEQLWRHRVDADGNVDPRGVAVGGGLAYLFQRRHLGADVGGAVSLFDVDAEEHIDTIEFDRPTFVYAIGEYIYVSTVTSDDKIHAYASTDERWSIEFGQAPVQFLLAGGTLYVGTIRDRNLTAIDAASGDELWTHEGAFPLAVVGETIYARTADDRFVALRE